MSAVNNIHIIGRLGKEPEMKFASSGTPFTKVSVAVDTRRNGDESQPDWFNVVAFNKTAEFLNQYGAKGRLVAVEGEMHQNRWEDQDGTPRTSWELVANSFQFLDKPRDTASGEDEPDFE